MAPHELEPGRIYFVAFGENTQLVFRHKQHDTTKQLYHAALHYWNGYERFDKNGYFVNSGISELRPASKPEKHSLFQKEIENETI